MKFQYEDRIQVQEFNLLIVQLERQIHPPRCDL